jgi:hypothetical protein
MVQRNLRRFVLLLLVSHGLVRGAEAWAHLKLGMNPEETLATLGAPLFRSGERGFELWIYDRHAEVLFYGSLVGWTNPATGLAPGASRDVWSSNPNAASFPTFLSALPPPPPPPKKVRLPQNLVPYAPDRLPTYRFRR